MDVLGPEAATEHDDPLRSSLQRLWLSSRSDTIYAGSNEIQLNLIAERALGMPRAARPTWRWPRSRAWALWVAAWGGLSKWC